MLAVALCYGRRVVDRTPRRLLALAILAAVGVACDGSDPAPPASPTSALPSASASAVGPTGGGSTGSTGSPPGPSSGSLTEGALELTVSGDVDAEATLTRLISGVASASGGFAVVWGGAGMDASTVGIGGGSFAGTQPTAPTLVLTITAQTADGLFTWVSSAGECDVTLEAAGPDRFAGSFACDGLTSGAGEVVDAAGSFEATG